MFEALEAGNKMRGSEFDQRSLPLRQQLLQAQFDLAVRDYPVSIVIAGLDGSGKGALIHRLNEWMDPRGIETNTYWEHSDVDESHPHFWRFWRKLPPRGQIAIFLGSWYSRTAQMATQGRIKSKALAHQCQQIESFERMLTDDGALVIKIWLHVRRDTRERKLDEARPSKKHRHRDTDQPYELGGSYKKSLKACEKIILATDTPHSPWHLIEADDRQYRDIIAGEIILNALQARASRQAMTGILATANDSSDGANRQPTVLDSIDLDQTLGRDSYKNKLTHYQDRLRDLSWEAYRQKRPVIAIFEGWDAAGKGSAIRRVTRAIDPRLYRVLQYAAPTEEERDQHYLWRFWRDLPRDGRTTLFDRSWYGRVLVERVEQLASNEEWQRAYREINQFEEQLVEHGSIVLKFWIHISEDEQLARFKERELKPHKHHKITPEDWRNREKWPDYEAAVDQMVSRTSTPAAPWTLVAGNSKQYARVQILKTFCKTLERELDNASADKD